MKATTAKRDKQFDEIAALAVFAALESIEKPAVIFEHKSRAGTWRIFHARDAEGRDHFLHERPEEERKDEADEKFRAIDADQASGMIAVASMPDCLKEHFAGLLLRALQPKGGAR